jgi:hypothetical protein
LKKDFIVQASPQSLTFFISSSFLLLLFLPFSASSPLLHPLLDFLYPSSPSASGGRGRVHSRRKRAERGRRPSRLPRSSHGECRGCRMTICEGGREWRESDDDDDDDDERQSRISRLVLCIINCVSRAAGWAGLEGPMWVGESVWRCSEGGVTFSTDQLLPFPSYHASGYTNGHTRFAGWID